MLGAAFAELWEHPALDGPYGDRSREPEDQPKLTMETARDEDYAAAGVATLPDRSRVPCATWTYAGDGSLDFWIPLGSLSEVWPHVGPARSSMRTRPKTLRRGRSLSTDGWPTWRAASSRERPTATERSVSSLVDSRPMSAAEGAGRRTDRHAAGARRSSESRTHARSSIQQRIAAGGRSFPTVRGSRRRGGSFSATSPDCSAGDYAGLTGASRW